MFMKLQIDIPESLNDITLGQAQRYYNIYEKHKEDENATDFLDKKLVQIFCDIPLTVVNTIRKIDYDDIVTHLKNILNEKNEFVNTFYLYGVEFGFIPDMENITGGEYADLEKYLTDVNTYHKAMAVCYRPIVKNMFQKLSKKETKGNYNIIDYNGTGDYSEVMKQMPYGIVCATIVFFWTLRIDLLTYTLKYLKTELRNLKTNGSEINGDGYRHLTQSLEVVTLKLKKLRESHFTEYYCF